ncbi:hypothetical protein LPJ73_001697 [Coemansia sp. RSA 2703]|nr:hypothetical protein LPJ73_001697 [Coemansia sp. RSA 2703]KAJ2373914.1 hypothetical protein IW150_003378 [Coemansia sp. RSA 2607]KAJ2396449.1 hypothetical protein GGI05_001111 [Coemansia sp. RSA 2603]
MKLIASTFAFAALLVGSTLAAPAGSSSSRGTVVAKPIVGTTDSCSNTQFSSGARVISFSPAFKLAGSNRSCGQCAKVSYGDIVRYAKYVGPEGCVGCSSAQMAIDLTTFRELVPEFRPTDEVLGGFDVSIVPCGSFDIMGNGTSL